MTIILHPNERVDQLPNHDIKIIQSPEVFCYSLDAVLLANFAKPPKNGKVIDLCSGNGVISLLMSRQTNSHITAIELQPRLADMAVRSIAMNHLEKQIQVMELDLKNSTQFIKKDSVDLIVTNPPYFQELPTSIKNPNPFLAIARHEIHTNLEEVIQLSSQLLKMNGRITMVHRPDRLLDILHIMQKHRIAPKKIQFVYPKLNKDANILLVEGIKDGSTTGFKILPPIYIHDENNHYSLEMQQIFANL